MFVTFHEYYFLAMHVPFHAPSFFFYSRIMVFVFRIITPSIIAPRFAS
jgi:hypothetical protein